MIAEYDQLPYDDFPFAETHPEHLAALATLFGLSPARPERARILELGCGRGGNLVPMAEALPQSTFCGVDLSSLHIAAAREEIAALGLGNVRVDVADIRELDASLGTFDFILCHGVYSWVDEDVQKHILRVCRELLAPDGIAYLSYNTLPGWHLRGAIRDMLLLESGRSGDAERRIASARDLLSLLSHMPATHEAGAWVRSEVELLRNMSDAYLLYEHLAQHNRPVYFRDLASAALTAGLAYVTDASSWMRSAAQLGPEVEAWIDAHSRSLLDTEHHLDLLEVRFFRRSLFCRRDRNVDRRISWPRLLSLWLATDVSPPDDAAPPADAAEETFRGPGDTQITVSEPLLRSVLRQLHEHERGLLFPDLVARARAAIDGAPVQPATEADLELAGGNLLSLLARGLIEARPSPRPYVRQWGERPRTTAVARRHAATGHPGATTLRHRRVPIDSLDRALLARMDGAHDRAALVDFVVADLAAGTLRIEVDGEPITDRESAESLVAQKLDVLAARAFAPDLSQVLSTFEKTIG